jgi:hypothetical protein
VFPCDRLLQNVASVNSNHSVPVTSIGFKREEYTHTPLSSVNNMNVTFKSVCALSREWLCKQLGFGLRADWRKATHYLVKPWANHRKKRHERTGEQSAMNVCETEMPTRSNGGEKTNINKNALARKAVGYLDIR